MQTCLHELLAYIGSLLASLKNGVAGKYSTFLLQAEYCKHYTFTLCISIVL